MVLAAGELAGLVVIRDSLEMEGGFLLLHLVRLAAAQGRPVVLASTKSAAAHYGHALRKALGGGATAGRVRVLPALRHLRPAGGSLDLLELQREVAGATAAAAAEGGPPPLVAVDDASLLLAAAGGQPAALAHFLASLAELAEGCCAAVVAHSDVPGDAPLLARLEHEAAVVAEVEPLGSGRSAEVSGLVRVLRRRAPRGAGVAQHAAPGLGWSSTYVKLQDAGPRFLATTQSLLR